MCCYRWHFASYLKNRVNLFGFTFEFRVGGIKIWFQRRRSCREPKVLVIGISHHLQRSRM